MQASLDNHSYMGRMLYRRFEALPYKVDTKIRILKLPNELSSVIIYLIHVLMKSHSLNSGHTSIVSSDIL